MARAPKNFCFAIDLNQRGIKLAIALFFSYYSKVFERTPMARVTVEDCLETVNNRFALVILGAKRTRQLINGASPLVKGKNKPAVMALREIADGKVKPDRKVEDVLKDPGER